MDGGGTSSHRVLHRYQIKEYLRGTRGIPASLLARGDEITNNKQPKRNIYKAGIEGDYINNTQTVILISTNIQEKKKIKKVYKKEKE